MGRRSGAALLFALALVSSGFVPARADGTTDVPLYPSSQKPTSNAVFAYIAGVSEPCFSNGSLSLTVQDGTGQRTQLAAKYNKLYLHMTVNIDLAKYPDCKVIGQAQTIWTESSVPPNAAQLFDATTGNLLWTNPNPNLADLTDPTAPKPTPSVSTAPPLDLGNLVQVQKFAGHADALGILVTNADCVVGPPNNYVFAPSCNKPTWNVVEMLLDSDGSTRVYRYLGSSQKTLEIVGIGANTLFVASDNPMDAKGKLVHDRKIWAIDDSGTKLLGSQSASLDQAYATSDGKALAGISTDGGLAPSIQLLKFAAKKASAVFVAQKNSALGICGLAADPNLKNLYFGLVMPNGITKIERISMGSWKVAQVGQSYGQFCVSDVSADGLIGGYQANSSAKAGSPASIVVWSVAKQKVVENYAAPTPWLFGSINAFTAANRFLLSKGIVMTASTGLKLFQAETGDSVLTLADSATPSSNGAVLLNRSNGSLRYSLPMNTDRVDQISNFWSVPPQWQMTGVRPTEVDTSAELPKK